MIGWLKFDYKTIEIIWKLLKISTDIVELDISWNNLISNQLFKVFQSLEDNKSILELDISCNSMPKSDIMSFKPISNFLQSNSQIMHLDFSWMNLGVELVYLLCKTVSKSESVLSLHLSGNEWTKGVINNLRQSFGIKIDRKETLNLAHSTVINKKVIPQFFENDTKFDFSRVNLNFLIKLEQRESDRVMKSVVIPSKWQKFISSEDKLIYFRMINHREISGSYHWIESNECYFWEKWQYTVLRFEAILHSYGEIQDITTDDEK